MLIKFDDPRQGIFAEWPAGQPYSESRLLTWPVYPAPDTARTVSAETLNPARFYQVGYGWPYDAGDIAGDVQASIAWKRRWATWHNSGDGLFWRVAEVTAYAVEEESVRRVEAKWDLTAAVTLHDVYGEQDEDGYREFVMTSRPDPTDAQIHDFVRNVSDGEVTQRARDWFESEGES